MGRPLENKCKQCRRAGVKLYLKGERCNTSKCPIVRRNYPPGQHGQKGQRRLTEYGNQLAEKQRARRTYRLMEKQFRSYYEEANSAKGNTGEMMAQLLELRLDNVVFRAGFAPSRDAARQMVGHGHIEVNGKKVTIPSYRLREKEVITVRENSKTKGVATDLTTKMEQAETPNWVLVDPKAQKATVESVPDASGLATGLSMNTIVEFYSR